MTTLLLAYLLASVLFSLGFVLGAAGWAVFGLIAWGVTQ